MKLGVGRKRSAAPRYRLRRTERSCPAWRHGPGRPNTSEETGQPRLCVSPEEFRDCRHEVPCPSPIPLIGGGVLRAGSKPPFQLNPISPSGWGLLPGRAQVRVVSPCGSRLWLRSRILTH